MFANSAIVVFGALRVKWFSSYNAENIVYNVYCFNGTQFTVKPVLSGHPFKLHGNRYSQWDTIYS